MQLSEVTNKDIQPLLHDQHIESITFKEIVQPGHDFNRQSHAKGDFQNLKIDVLQLVNAVQQANVLGYNYNEILEAILSQMPVNSKEIKLSLPKRINAPLRNPKELLEELKQYGYRIEIGKNAANTLTKLQSQVGICYVGDIINAINYQIRLNGEEGIDLKISQEPSLQKRWIQNLSYNDIAGDIPKQTLQHMKIQKDGQITITKKEDHK